MIPPTSNRVESASSSRVNVKIYESTIASLSKILGSSPTGRAALVEDRLKQLDREWDMERMLEFNASTLLVISGLLTYFYSHYWLFAVLAVASFLWQHSVQGWCPPMPILRGIFGIRTNVEILSEKVALKMIRGDFQSVQPTFLEKQENDDVQGAAKKLLDAADLHCNTANQIKPKEF